MLRIGIVGAGDISFVHADVYTRLPNTQIVAWADPVEGNAQKRAELFGGRVFSTIQELLDREHVDIVDICSPDSLHTIHAEEALRAGKHVLCEKPLGLDIQEAEAIVRLAQESPNIFMVGQVLRFFPEYEWIRAFVKEGTLGEPIAAYAARLNPYPVWREWFRNPKISGGVATDLMIHDVDYCHWVFGRAERVSAIGKKDQYGIWNHVQSLLSFSSGVTATVEASYLMPSGFPTTFIFRLLCENGCIEYAKRAEKTVTVFEPEKEPSYPEIVREDPFLKEIKYFVGCVERGEKPEFIRPEEALYSLRIVLAVLDSLEKNGEPVAIETGLKGSILDA
jgi:predicted dehydrogenase